MISSHLVFLALIAQAAICAVPPPQRIQKPAPSQASSSPGFYGFAVNSATPYVPQVEENQEDSRRRLDLLENHFKARDFTTAGNTAEVAEMEVENEFNGPAILFEEPRRDQEQDVFKALLKKVKILPNVDMGERWDTYFMDRNECRVSIFGVRTHDIQDVLHVMIQFGPIERAWMLDELKRYGRPNIVFVEYAHRWDAQEAIKLARTKFASKVGVSPCKSNYSRRGTRLKICFTPNTYDLDKYLNVEYLEREFGSVVELGMDRNRGVAFITFNWISNAIRASDFFKDIGCRVHR